MDHQKHNHQFQELNKDIPRQPLSPSREDTHIDGSPNTLNSLEGFNQQLFATSGFVIEQLWPAIQETLQSAHSPLFHYEGGKRITIQKISHQEKNAKAFILSCLKSIFKYHTQLLRKKFTSPTPLIQKKQMEIFEEYTELLHNCAGSIYDMIDTHIDPNRATLPEVHMSESSSIGLSFCLDVIEAIPDMYNSNPLNGDFNEDIFEDIIESPMVQQFYSQYASSQIYVFKTLRAVLKNETNGIKSEKLLMTYDPQKGYAIRLQPDTLEDVKIFSEIANSMQMERDQSSAPLSRKTCPIVSAKTKTVDNKNSTVLKEIQKWMVRISKELYIPWYFERKQYLKNRHSM